MDDFQKFEKTELPSRDDFTNDLTKKKISDDDWDFVNDLWKTFQLKNLGELHDLYMICICRLTRSSWQMCLRITEK